VQSYSDANKANIARICKDANVNLTIKDIDDNILFESNTSGRDLSIYWIANRFYVPKNVEEVVEEWVQDDAGDDDWGGVPSEFAFGARKRVIRRSKSKPKKKSKQKRKSKKRSSKPKKKSSRRKQKK